MRLEFFILRVYSICLIENSSDSGENGGGVVLRVWAFW